MRSFRYVLGYGRFKTQSLLSVFKAQSDYTCWKDSSSKFWKEVYIKGTLFFLFKTFSVVIMMFCWLLVNEKK